MLQIKRFCISMAVTLSVSLYSTIAMSNPPMEPEFQLFLQEQTEIRELNGERNRAADPEAKIAEGQAKARAAREAAANAGRKSSQ